MSIVSQSRNSRLYGKHKEALDKLSSGLVKDAISILVELATADPTNGFVCMDMGYALVKMGMYDKAVVAARQAIELDSTSVEAFLLLATTLTRKGDLAGANVALLRAIDLLRNPYRTEEEYLNEKHPRPLVIAEQCAIFIDFTMEGDINNLSFKSLSPYKNGDFILKIALAGNVTFSCDAGYTQVGGGQIEKERLIACVQPELANVVKIFTFAKFGYFIFQRK